MIERFAGFSMAFILVVLVFLHNDRLNHARKTIKYNNVIHQKQSSCTDGLACRL